MADFQQELFNYFSQEHNISLLESEMFEIENIVKKTKCEARALTVGERTGYRCSCGGRYVVKEVDNPNLLPSKLSDLLAADKDELELIAHDLTETHIGKTYGEPKKHWCYDNIYRGILFAIRDIIDS